MSKPENPSAFPQNKHSIGRLSGQYEGMTLRDWFAGQALPSVAGREYSEWQIQDWFGDRNDITVEELRAKAAYSLADAMLAERERSTQSADPA